MDHSNVEGVILKISVENFLTYDDTVIKPGRNLNVIIGPNDTGKSTIVCAIVLGLGGKLKAIGRALNVGEYVKSGCRKAKIEIELSNPAGKDYVIGRHFTTDGQSTWFLNERLVSSEEIESLTKKLNIHVDELCQFLHQEKVQDFYAMNPQQLLENTEKSIGDTVLLEYHIKLKELQKKHIALQEQITNKSNLLKKHTDEYDRLKEIIRGIKEKTAIKKKIMCLKQKRAWMIYTEARSDLTNVKNMRDAAIKDMNELVSSMKLVEQAIAIMKSGIVQADNLLSRQIEVTFGKARSLTSVVEQIRSYGEKIQEIERSLAYKIQMEVTRQQEIATAQQKRSELENDLNLITREFGYEKALAEKQRAINPLIEEHRKFINQVTSKMHESKQEEEEIRRRIMAQEAKLQTAKDVESQRLTLLRHLSQDAYKGVMWLRENTDKFSTIIHEPMILKINVVSKRYSKYFENTIAQRDLCAFVCENEQDMNMLLTHLRDEQRLQVICVHSDPNENVDMNPKIPIDCIAQFGFQHYLSSLIDAPQAIMNYLVSMYRINNIPIGNDNVENNVEHIPSALNIFYSKNNLYSVSVDKYNGKKSIRMSRVSGNDTLSAILDATKLERIQAILSALNEEKKFAAHMTEEIEKQLVKADERMKELRAQRTEFQQRTEQISTVRWRIAMADRKIQDLQNQITSIEEIKDTNKRQINHIIIQQVKAYQRYNVVLEEYIEANHSSACAELEMKLLYYKLATKQSECYEMMERCNEAARSVRSYDCDLEPLEAEAKRMHEDALAMANGVGPLYKGFEKLTKQYFKLPSTIEEINNELKAAQARVFCMGNARNDDNFIRDYEKVEVDVENMKQEIEAKTNELQNIILEMEDIRGKWMPSLESLVKNINKNFSLYLSIMSYAGEVSVTHGENIMDFEEYGLKIKVKFRDTDQLQELTRTQSGGERTVTTATYMIALQELSTVPFRCVDEINQGMDSINERRIFELIVKIAEKASGSQYFLLTSNLVPALLYKDAVTVHCMFNNPFGISQIEFDLLPTSE